MPPQHPENQATPTPATPPANPPAAPIPAAQPHPAAQPIDPKSILLPKKEGSPSVDSAQRINAGALLAQEVKAGTDGTDARTIGAVSKPTAPVVEPKEEPLVKALETYGSDINRVVQSGEVSVASMAAAESKRAHMASGETLAPGGVGESPTPTQSPIRTVLYIAGGILLLSAVGILATLMFRPGPVAVQQNTQAAPFMEVDQTILVPAASPLRRDVLMTSLNTARKQLSIPLGLVAQLYVADGTSSQPISVQTLLSTLAPDIPQDLLRTLEQPYLLAVHSFDENEAFLVLRVDSYQQAYAGMLAWEPTMRNELLPLFTRTPPAHIQAQTIGTIATSTQSQDASSTPADGFLRTGFVDQVVDNHDARVMVTPDGDLLLLWTFTDRNTLVIATNEYTLNEIIRRLTTASLVPQPQ